MQRACKPYMISTLFVAPAVTLNCLVHSGCILPTVAGQVGHALDVCPALPVLLLGCSREKNSSKVDRLVQFKGTSQIVTLPPYLTVQMMRFFFKRTPDGGQKAKILRKVCQHCWKGLGGCLRLS